MKITQKALEVLTMGILFFCCLTPLSYSSEATDSPSRQELISIINLTDESSSNVVIQKNGAIEFKGNELVASVRATMAANGTIPFNSTMAIPKAGTDMAIDLKTAPIPLALVEKDLQVTINSAIIEPVAITQATTKISQKMVERIPLENIFSIPHDGIPSSPVNLARVGTGGEAGEMKPPIVAGAPIAVFSDSTSSVQNLGTGVSLASPLPGYDPPKFDDLGTAAIQASPLPDAPPITD